MAPILFASYPVLSLYSININQVAPDIVVVPLLASWGACALIWALSAWLFRSASRGALMSAGVFLFSIFLGILFNLADQTIIGKFIVDEYHGWLCATALLGLVGLGRYFKRMHHVLEAALIFTVMGCGMSALPLLHIALRETKVATRTTENVVHHQPSGSTTQLRDIYYIILDGYARQDVLRDVYGYDNSAFIQFLRSKGFYVADKARSNYGFTLLSLSSSLNFNYLDGLSLAPDQETICTQRLQHNKVMDFLAQKGYQIVHFSSGWVVTGRPMPQATIHFNARSFNKFNIQLVQTSLLRLVISNQFEYASQAEYIRYNLRMAREVPLVEGPKFVFLHIVSPHPPFLFDRNGHLAPRPKGFQRLEADWMPKERYVDQLHYITTEIQQVITAILERSKIPPIILLQSDHGPALPGLSNIPDPDIVYARSSILDAFYLPGLDYQKWLYPTMTPVNSFRRVFNAYFNAGFDYLPDTTYYSGPIGASPYEFHDVTNMKR